MTENPKYHFKPHELRTRLRPQQMGLDYTSVQRLELVEPVSLESVDEELCLVCLEGSFEFLHKHDRGKVVTKDMIYVPPQTGIVLTPEAYAVVMRFGAPSTAKTQLKHIRFLDVNDDPVRHRSYGKAENNSLREVWHFIDDDFQSERFLVGICKGAIGAWTAWPPHEHGATREEVYTYFGMEEAFGIQCVYEDMDRPIQVALVRDGDLVSVPRGYHPNVGCSGGRISYVYCMVSKTPWNRKFMDLTIHSIYGDRFE